MTPVETRSATLAELDSRTTDGVEISLLWDRTNHALTLRTRNRYTCDVTEWDVPPDQASYAFHHPNVFTKGRFDRVPRRTKSRPVEPASTTQP